MLTEKFDKDKYNTTEIFTTVKKSGLISVALLVPLYIIGVCVYLLQRNLDNILMTVFKATFLLEVLISAFGVFLFIVIAMLAKAALLSIFAEGNFANVKFKIIKESQKPHCCLTEPIKTGQYQFCLAVYILIAGILPYILALIIGDFLFVLASFLCVFFSSGDIIFFISLFGWKKELNVSKPNALYVLDFEGIVLYRLYAEHSKKAPF